MVGNVQAGRIAQERARIAKEQQQMRAARAARMSGQPKANIASSLGPTASPTLTPSAPSKPYQIGDGLGPMMKDTSGDDAQPAPDSDLKPYDFSKSDGGMGPLG